jgi:hypothetical protein
MFLRQWEEAHALAGTVPHTQSAADTSPWMVCQYVPGLGTGGSSATIALIQASSMTFLVNGAAPAGLDAIGVSGVIDTSSSSYDTMGELVDYINGRSAWRAYLVGALRADGTSGLLAKSAASAFGDNGLTFFGDTSVNEAAVVPGTEAAYEQVSVAISGEKFTTNSIGGHVTDADDGCENMLQYAEVQLTFTGTGTLRIYSGAQGSTETMIYNQTLTSTTEQNLGRTGTTQADGLNSIFLKATRGERLIIRAATLTAFSAYTKFNILGKTAVLKNDRIVTEDNY